MKRIFCLLTIFFCTLFAFNASAQEERDSPRRGEGISVFLERNKRPGRAYYKEFLELNKKLLKGKEELRLGVKYVLPPLSKPVGNGKKTINEPLFGKALASVKVTSNRLQGACFYVVSGHGGPDPGAIGRIGKIELHEDEYAYDVALRLARNLMQEGAEVRIIIQDAKDGIRDDKYLSKVPVMRNSILCSSYSYIRLILHALAPLDLRMLRIESLLILIHPSFGFVHYLVYGISLSPPDCTERNRSLLLLVNYLFVSGDH